MKFVFGIPNKNRQFKDQFDKWKILNEANQKMNYIIGIIIGIFLLFIISNIIELFTSNINLDFKVYKYLYVLLLVIPIHELFHLIFFPSLRNATIGFSLKRAIFFVTLSDIISKKRFLAITISPFLFLTIIPLVILFFIKSNYLAYFCLYNALASGLDIIMFFILLKKKNVTQLKFNGDDLFFKSG